MAQTKELQKETNSSLKDNSKKRVQYLDIIKVISIFFVVFCHKPLLQSNSVVDNIIMLFCWCAVPCFFMSTGALYLNKEWNFKKYIIKLLNIYLVLCVWKIIFLLIYYFMGKVDIFTVSKESIFSYIFLFNGLEGVDDLHFWFMYAYISVYIIYPFVNLIFKNIKDYKYFIIFILIIVFIATAFSHSIRFILDVFKIENIQISNIGNKIIYGNYSFVLIYFLLGGLLYKYNVYDKFADKKVLIRIISILMIVVGIVGLLFIKRFYSETFEWKDIYLKDGYHWTSTICLSLGIFILFQGIEFKNKIISKVISEVGKSTLGIYYMHILIIELTKLVNIEYRGSLINLARTIVVIFISYLIVVIIRQIPLLKKIVQ